MIRLACLVWLVLPRTASAHDLRPGVLAFVEVAPGDLRVRFVPPIDTRGEAVELALVLPDGCTRTGDRVRCRDGFGGELAVGGMRGHVMKIFVSLERDGTRRDWVLTSDAPRLDLGPAPPASAHAWVREGVHAFALAHVAFAIALVLAFGASRGLVWALVAFTLARVLAGQLHASGPFDALVALSALVLARAAVVDRTPRPWLLGAMFGVVHGLALPGGAWFQLGVVIAQLAVVALAAALFGLIGKRRVVGVRAHRAAGYALGALAAWLLLRGA